MTPLWFIAPTALPDNSYHAQPGVDPFSEAVGAERQTAVFLLQMSPLFKQSRQTVGIKLGGLPCEMDTFLEEQEIYSTKTDS